jgi:hypothetical protein
VGHTIRSALGALLTIGGMSTAVADVWIVHDRVLERRDVDGSIVTTVSEPFGTPIGTLIDDGEVDPRPATFGSSLGSGTRRNLASSVC